MPIYKNPGNKTQNNTKYSKIEHNRYIGNTIYSEPIPNNFNNNNTYATVNPKALLTANEYRNQYINPNSYTKKLYFKKPSTSRSSLTSTRKRPLSSSNPFASSNRTL